MFGFELAPSSLANRPVPKFWVDDFVEVRSEHMRRTPFVARIIDVRWNVMHHRHEYLIERRGRILYQRCLAEHLVASNPFDPRGGPVAGYSIGDDSESLELQAATPEA